MNTLSHSLGIVLASLFVGALVIIYFGIKGAPDGHEDKNGFHIDEV